MGSAPNTYELNVAAFNFCEGDGGGSYDEALALGGAGLLLLDHAPDNTRDEDPSAECAQIPEELSFAACDPNACYVHESYFACFTSAALTAQFQGLAPLLVGLSADELQAVFSQGASNAFDAGAWNDAREHIMLPLDAHWPAPPLGAFAALAVVVAAALGRLQSHHRSSTKPHFAPTARRAPAQSARNRSARATTPRKQKPRSRERPSPINVEAAVQRHSASDDPPTPFSASSEEEAGSGLAPSTSGTRAPAASGSDGVGCAINDEAGWWERVGSKRAQKRQNRARCPQKCVVVLGPSSAHLATAVPSMPRVDLSPIAAEFKPSRVVDKAQIAPAEIPGADAQDEPLVRFGDF